MPDLGKLENPSSLPPISDSNPATVTNRGESSSTPNSDSLKTFQKNENRREFSVCRVSAPRVLKRFRGERTTGNNSEYDKDFINEKIEKGDSKEECFVPIPVGAKKLVKCRMCQDFIYPGTDLPCSVHGCQAEYHFKCVKQRLGGAHTNKFKCPQHACYLCKQKLRLWRCVRCEVACHEKCAPFPEHVKHIRGQPGQAICWKHTDDLHQEEKLAAPAKSIAEVFDRLPLPDVPEEFDIDRTCIDIVETDLEPTPYIHIRRNVYLVKKKRHDRDDDVGCTNCVFSDCSERCVCRFQYVSCSKACRCSDMCTNRPFRKEKKIKVVKTELCGWGVEAAESIDEGEFIIEYVGEVIDDVTCETRLWEMKNMKKQKFYLCEVRKDFNIDATYKGNASRFLNHSCDPNCNLEKWELDGETRLGIFAARSIQAGEPLTYDYRYIQFGDEVKCLCGAQNCKGYLGVKKKNPKVEEVLNKAEKAGDSKQLSHESDETDCKGKEIGSSFGIDMITWCAKDRRVNSSRTSLTNTSAEGSINQINWGAKGRRRVNGSRTSLTNKGTEGRINQINWGAKGRRRVNSSRTNLTNTSTEGCSDQINWGAKGRRRVNSSRTRLTNTGTEGHINWGAKGRRRVNGSRTSLTNKGTEGSINQINWGAKGRRRVNSSRTNLTNTSTEDRIDQINWGAKGRRRVNSSRTSLTNTGTEGHINWGAKGRRVNSFRTSLTNTGTEGRINQINWAAKCRRL